LNAEARNLSSLGPEKGKTGGEKEKRFESKGGRETIKDESGKVLCGGKKGLTGKKEKKPTVAKKKKKKLPAIGERDKNICCEVWLQGDYRWLKRGKVWKKCAEKRT